MFTIKSQTGSLKGPVISQSPSTIQDENYEYTAGEMLLNFGLYDNDTMAVSQLISSYMSQMTDGNIYFSPARNLTKRKKNG